VHPTARWSIPLLAVSAILSSLGSACSSSGGGGGGTRSGQLEVDRAQVDFGEVVVGAQAQQAVVLSNVGTADAPISSVGASGGYAEADDCPAALAAGTACTITVTLAPRAAGAQGGQLTVEQPSAGPIAVTLAGAGVYRGVLTYHGDEARSGAYPETSLSPANVSEATFGKLATFPVDGQVYAQPLWVSSVEVPGKGVHDVAYVATEHDSLYAFDASGLAAEPLWSVSFIAPPDVVPISSDDTGCEDLVPEVGITSTPVIDRTTGTLYVLARTKEAATTQAPTYVQRLHALDLSSGAERAGSPVTLAAAVPGTGDGGDQVVFDPFRENQRAALLLSGGTVYIAFASHCDNTPYHGWVLGYDAATLQQTAVFNDTPDGGLGGIWQSGAGPAADAAGAVYVVTGNGTFDASGAVPQLGDSFVKLSAGGAVLDWFTPYNQAYLSSGDLDLGSSGPLLLPDQPGAHPHLLVGAGKEGTIYVIDRDDMGHFHAGSDSQIVQALVAALPAEHDSAPTYWNGRVYFAAQGDAVKAFTLSGGMLSEAPVSETPDTFPLKGGFPVVSSAGDAAGILWAYAVPGPGAGAVLHAYDAIDLQTELWNSTLAGSRDALAPAAKFSVPIVAGGRVYVATDAGLSVFGLLP
jgi:hypothetical protein